MNYREPKPITREAFEKALAQNRPEQVCEALVDATHSIADREWVTEVCLRLLNHPNADVAGTAITCLGHIARLEGRINTRLVGEALCSLYRKEVMLRGRIQDAVDDIKMFTGEDIVLSA